jgi:hypothetical protein
MKRQSVHQLQLLTGAATAVAPCRKDNRAKAGEKAKDNKPTMVD